MKKLLLMITGGLLAASSVLAQTNSDDSGNKPTATDNGYTFAFNTPFGVQATNEQVNCVNTGSGGTIPWFATTGYTIDMAGATGAINVQGAVGRGYWTHWKFTSGNCATDAISFPGTGDVVVKIRAKSDVAGTPLFVDLNTTIGSGPSAMLEITNANKTITLGTTYAVYTVTFTNADFTAAPSGYTRSSVEGVSFHLGNEGTAAYNINIDWITVGDALSLGTNDASVDNSLINVFPNPAKDQVNVDLSLLNGKEATVKVINALGGVVVEEVTSANSYPVSVANLEKGIYMIQVTSGNRVSNKKVVVE
ncbi:MAG: T9SS type A sorting domain-containing protein [Cytophagaceae bacterium]|nr:T9SS type A sorting domain-containing protein [Cytophagaceae bacterium]